MRYTAATKVITRRRALTDTIIVTFTFGQCCCIIIFFIIVVEVGRIILFYCLTQDHLVYKYKQANVISRVDVDNSETPEM